MGRSLLAAMALEVGTSTIGDLAIRPDHSPSTDYGMFATIPDLR